MLHVLTHSFPTRRSSDLHVECILEDIDEDRSGIEPGDDLGGRREREGGHEDRVTRLHLHRHQAEAQRVGAVGAGQRSEEHTSELQSLMRISSAGFCLKKKTILTTPTTRYHALTEP